MKQKVIDYFEIPEDLAKRLTDLLATQSIRERLLINLVDQPAKYKEMEKELVKVVREIEAIKITITSSYVPEKYNSPEYMWNYDGWDIDENKVQIIQ